MQIYGPRYLHGAQPIGGPHATQPARKASEPAPRGEIQDEVQISDAAQALDKIDDIPGIRHDRVKQIRAQIEAGTYETPEKLDAALDRMLDEIA